jgi:hypothetical protein
MDDDGIGPEPSSLCAVRLFARWVDDPRECPFAFDLILARETGRVCGDWPVLGATDLDGAQPRPFVLDADGRLDFGADDRVWRTDLRAHALGVGRRFTVWWTEEDPAAYEVVKIAALGAKGERLRFALPERTISKRT